MGMEIEVRITIKELYTYLLYRAYTNVVGIFETIVGIILMICFMIDGGYLYFFAGLVVLLYLPLSLYTKAARQLGQQTDEFGLVHYRMSEEGIFSDEGDLSKMIPWQSVLKVKSIHYSIIIITKTETIILPNKDIEKNFSNLLMLITKYVSADRIKVKKNND